jgi:magnesium-transporting ATPase (P-type)
MDSNSSSDISREQFELGDLPAQSRTETPARVEEAAATSPSSKKKKKGKKKDKNKTVEQPPYHCDTYEQVLQKFETSIDGLSDEEVTKRLAQHGDNILKGEGGVCVY